MNLYNDKFLRNAIKNDPDKGVDVNILLKINKVREILNDFDRSGAKVRWIKSAVEMSKNLKFVDNKIIRVKQFDFGKINSSDVDKRTIYLQKLPSTISHDDILKIFSNYLYYSEILKNL